MFDFPDGDPASKKAEICKIIIELKPVLNSDIQFDVGYLDGEGNFVKTSNRNRHLRQERTLQMIQIIQDGANPAAAKQNLEDLLVLELAKDPDVPPPEEE